MLNNGTTFEKLDSPIFGALLQAVAITSQTLGSSAAAVRIIGGNVGELGAYGEITALRLTPTEQKTIHAWPPAEDPLYDRVRRQNLLDQVFRPREVFSVAECNRSALFRPIAVHRPLIDALCLTFNVVDKAWGLMLHLRCGDCLPFADEEIETLGRFKQPIALLIRNSYHRQFNTREPAGVSASRDAHRLSPEQAAAKLTRTEQQVLHHLLGSTATERQIAQAIHRSPHTVHVHVKNIYRKLGVNSRRLLQALFEH